MQAEQRGQRELFHLLWKSKNSVQGGGAARIKNRTYIMQALPKKTSLQDRLPYEVVRETAICDNMLIEHSQQIRPLQLGEVMEAKH